MAAATEKTLPIDPKYDNYDFPTTAPEKQDGHPGHTTPEQDAKVYQLRTMLEQLGYTERLDTLTLLRFLRARKFDVEAAKAMYVVFLPEVGTALAWAAEGRSSTVPGRISKYSS
jgi:hypothetical protein